MSNKKIITVIGATIAASLCCITPILAVLAGSSTLASSFSWMAPYHNYLVGFTILVLLYAWYDRFKQSNEIDCECDEKEGFFSSKTFLAIVSIFSIVMLSFPQWGDKVFDAAPSAQSCPTGSCDTNITKEATVTKESLSKPSTENTACASKPFKNIDSQGNSVKPKDPHALKVFKYMREERVNPTPYNQKACAGSGRPEIDGLMRNARTQIEEMSPMILKKMIDSEDEFILLDVREVIQRSEGEIYADEMLQMTRGDLEFEIMNKIKNKEAVIVTYCRSGGRGLFSAETLKKLGYLNVYNLKGGLKAWATAGLAFDNGLGVVVKIEAQ